MVQWRKTLFCACILLDELSVSARYNNQKAYEAKFVVVVQQKNHLDDDKQKNSRSGSSMLWGIVQFARLSGLASGLNRAI